MERLAPAVLLVLFDGVPAVVHVEEPRQGIQFGVRLDPEDPPAAAPRQGQGARQPDRATRCRRRTTFTAANSVDVPFRPSAPGVINVTELRKRLAAKAPNTRRRRSSRTSTRCRCCASRTARCSATPTTPRACEFYDLDAFMVTIALTDLEGDRRRPSVKQAEAMSERSRRSTPARSARSPPASASSPPTARSSTSARSPPGIATCCASTGCSCRSTCRRCTCRRAATRRWCALPMLVAGAERHGVQDPEDGLPDPFDARARRGRPGVHLHWAMPDALLRGTLDAARRRRREPPRRCRCCPTAGWCCASSCRRARPTRRHGLGARGRPRRGGAARRRGPKAARSPQAHAVPAARWRSDAAHRARSAARSAGRASTTRCSTASPSTTRSPTSPTLAPDGVDSDCAAYLVAGWWSDAAHDPLDSGAQQRQPARAARAAALAAALRVGRRAVRRWSRRRRSSSCARRSA